MKLPESTRSNSGDSPQPPLAPLTLNWRSQDLLEAYTEQAWPSSRQFVRFSLLLAVALYLVFGLLDQRMVPDSAESILEIRLFVAVVLMAVFLFSFRPWFSRYFQAALALVVLVTGGGVLAMIALSDQVGGYRYYAGLMLVVMFGQAMLRLRFVYATAATTLVIAGYELLCATVVETPSDIILNNSFFLVASNILGMFTSYGVEYSAKTVFWQRQMLLKKQAALNREHSRKTRELEGVRAIQLAMLPNCLPGHSLMDICVSMKTASEVGGDYYDYVDGADGTLTFAIADAAGHGAQAGALVAAMKIIFSNHAAGEEVDLFLQKASQSLRAMGIPKLFLAAAVGKIKGESLEIAGAGLPPAILYRKIGDAVEHVGLKGVPLGTFADVPYTRQTVSLEPGDVLVLMTDGLLESANPAGEMYGQERADAFVKKAAPGLASEIVHELHAEAASWVAGMPQHDDITFLVIKRKPV